MSKPKKSTAAKAESAPKKKWKVWGSTLVHVVKIVEADTPLCGVPLLDGYASAWCGCPASAVAVAMGVRPVDIDEAGDQVDFLAETFGVEPRLVRAFTEGVDRRDFGGHDDDEMVAYAHGRTVREALGLWKAGK